MSCELLAIHKCEKIIFQHNQFFGGLIKHKSKNEINERPVCPSSPVSNDEVMESREEKEDKQQAR